MKKIFKNPVDFLDKCFFVFFIVLLFIFMGFTILELIQGNYEESIKMFMGFIVMGMIVVSYGFVRSLMKYGE